MLGEHPAVVGEQHLQGVAHGDNEGHPQAGAEQDATDHVLRPAGQVAGGVEGPVDLGDYPQRGVDLGVHCRHDAHDHDEPTGGTGREHAGDDAILESDELLLPGMKSRQIDLPEGLMAHSKVDPIRSDRELKGHGLVSLCHGEQ